MNILAIWIAAYTSGYEHGIWGTYKQWQERGAPMHPQTQGKIERWH